MSSLCPLCGNDKSEEALFCEECAKKIRNDYEVKIPERLNFAENVSSKDNFPESGKSRQGQEAVSKTGTFSKAGESVHEQANPGIVPKTNTFSDTGKSPHEQANDSQTIAEKEVAEAQEEPSFLNTRAESFSRKRKHGNRKGMVFGWVFAIGVLAAFSFVYKQYATRQTQEQMVWEEAESAHTVNAYLAYMNAYPNGKYVADAEAKMKALKDQEAATWEKLKTSGDVAELRDFLQQYPESPYRALVRNRLDSLMWIDAYTANTAQRYSEYMVAAESGELPGNYYHEAQKRFEMLFQSYPVSTEELDKIKAVVEGFYAALSDRDYKKLAEYLSPKVYRFFNKGTDSRENIVKALQLAKTKNSDSAVRFVPDLEALQYQKTPEDKIRINVPLVKQYGGEEGVARTVSGYIGHIEMDGEGRVVSIYETKPYGAEQ